MIYQLRFLLIFLSVSWLYIGFGQNPFDIKAPSGKKEVIKESNPTSKPAQENPNKPPASTQPTIPVVQKQTTQIVPSDNSRAGTQTTPSSSNNPFDIKPGQGNSAIPSTIAIPDPSTQDKKAIPAAPSSEPIKPPSVGLDGVSNPFNIVHPAPGQINSPQTLVPTPSQEVATITRNLSVIKDASTQNQGSISKNVWFVIYIFLFMLAAIAINFNRSYPIALIRSTYNQNQLRILFKDAFKGNHLLIFGILYFIFIINAGIFLYLSFRLFGLAPISLFKAILIIFGVYLIRHLILWIMAMIFPLTKEATFFSYTVGIHNLALGMALMLVNILLSFVDPETGKMLIFSGLTIILVQYLMRQARGLLNNMPMILSGKFHFIIYLCTVEIAPWILLSGILLR